MNKDYLLYLFKSKKHLNIFLVIVGLIPTGVYLLNGINNLYNIHITFGLFTGISLIEALLLPFINFNYLQSKRALDTYYNIPISKKSLLITNFIFTLAQVIITSIIGLIVPLCFNFGLSLNYLNIVILIMIWMIMIITILLFVLSIIYKTHSTIDSILILCAYLFMPVCVIIVSIVFSNVYLFGIRDLLNFIYEYLSIIYIYFYEMIDLIRDINYYSLININFKEIVMFIEIIAIMILSFISIKYDYLNRKAEVSETNSNNFFAYPLVIGFITMSALLTITLSRVDTYIMLILIIIIFVAYLIMTFVYRRKIQIGKKDLLLFAVSLIISFGIASVATTTDGFGLNRLYRSTKAVNDLYISVDLNDDGSSYYISGTKKYLDDPQAIDNLIALEDRLYDTYKSQHYYDGSHYDIFLYPRIKYEDQNGINYYFYENLYFDEDDSMDIVFDVIKELDDIEVQKSVYDENYNQTKYETISLDDFIKELED